MDKVKKRERGFMTRSIRMALAAGACCLAALTTASASAQSATSPPDPYAKACQRECLQGYMDKYLAAMAAHDASSDIFAKNVRFTENGVRLPFGNEGLWATASGVGHYKFYVPDVQTQQIAFMGTMMETARASSTGPTAKPDPVGIDVRLRINSKGKISEVEQIVARPDRPLGPGAATSSSPFPATGEAVEKMGSPNPVFLQDVPKDERMSRADLIRTANYYFAGLQRNTGKGYYPFTDDCLRHENGIVTAGPKGTIGMGGRPVQTCKEQFEKGLIGVVTGIRDRRFVAVDPQKGIVYAFAFFDHRPIDWTWELGELFKIEKGKIRRIEAIFIRAPYGKCSGWSTYEQCRSEKIQDVR